MNTQTGAAMWTHSFLLPDDPLRDVLPLPDAVIVRTSQYVASCSLRVSARMHVQLVGACVVPSASPCHTHSALAQQTGQQKWLYDPPFGAISCMSMDNARLDAPNKLFVGSGDAAIESLNVTMRERWYGAEETHTIQTRSVHNSVEHFLHVYGGRCDMAVSLLLLLIESIRTHEPASFARGVAALFCFGLSGSPPCLCEPCPNRVCGDCLHDSATVPVGQPPRRRGSLKPTSTQALVEQYSTHHVTSPDCS